jgi:hypothetical protein
VRTVDQSCPVESRKDLIWAGSEPKRVGMPKMMPSASGSSAGVITGICVVHAQHEPPKVGDWRILPGGAGLS